MHVFTFTHIYIYMCACMKNYFHFLHTLYISHLAHCFHSHPWWSLLRLDVLNGPFTLMLHIAQTRPGKWCAQNQFCGSLRRLQISIPPFLLLTYLHQQGATYLASYTFTIFYSLKAYSLSRELCISVV